MKIRLLVASVLLAAGCTINAGNPLRALSYEIKNLRTFSGSKPLSLQMMRDIQEHPKAAAVLAALTILGGAGIELKYHPVEKTWKWAKRTAQDYPHTTMAIGGMAYATLLAALSGKVLDSKTFESAVGLYHRMATNNKTVPLMITAAIGLIVYADKRDAINAAAASLMRSIRNLFKKSGTEGVTIAQDAELPVPTDTESRTAETLGEATQTSITWLEVHDEDDAAHDSSDDEYQDAQ